MNRSASVSPKSYTYRDFYECVGENYPEEELVFQSLRGIVRRDFIHKHLASVQGLLLDLGCNRGYYTDHYNGGRAIGVDLAFSVLKTAKSARPGILFVQGDAQTLGFIKPDRIDAIVCSEMIEHVAAPKRVLTECHRVLKGGGNLLVTTPNYSKKKPTWIDINTMRDFGVKGVNGDSYFHTAFRPEELHRMAVSSKFTAVQVGTLEKEVKYATRIPVTFYYLIKILNKRLFRSTKLERLNTKMLGTTSLFIFKLCRALGVNALLVACITEGVRSFLYAQKGKK